MPSLTELRALAEQARGRRDALQTSLLSVQKEVKILENEEVLLGLVCNLFRSLIDKEVSEGVKAVEKLQTEGLKVVFEDMDLSVKTNIDIQRGKVSVEMLTVMKTPTVEIEGLSTDSFGGSVLTVQSILLRVIVILRRGLRPLLLLDETLPAFDDNYVGNVGKFLSELCKRLDLDALVVTHNPTLFDAADHGYRIVRKGNHSWFEKIK